MSYNVDWDITIEFYYKTCQYKSKITGAIEDIKINRVHYEMVYSPVFPYWQKNIYIRSGQGVEYNKDELFNFGI